MPISNSSKLPISRKKIFLIWLFASLPLMLITAAFSVVIWNFIYTPVPGSTWHPITCFADMLFLVPVGWFLSFTSIFGWVNILFLTISIYKKWPKMLFGSGAATLAAGIFWPMIYITMQSN